MRIVVHGGGVTALVTAGALAASGHDVVLACPPSLQGAIEAGDRLPFDETGLDELLQQQRAAGRLLCAGRETVVPEKSGNRVAVHFLAHAPEQRAMTESLVESIAAFDGDLLLVNQTNFGVGATDDFGQRLAGLRAHLEVRTVAACLPDFLRRGSALANFNRPDRIILGTSDSWAEGLLREILRPFSGYASQVLCMPARDAEFTKQVVNGMLATRLSYMNDMANVAEVIGVDIAHVRRGVGSDERIGSAFLHPGCGFGGTGFYQDLLSLKETLDRSGVASRLLDTALDVNEGQKDLLFRKLWTHFRGELAGRRVAVWGAAFKPDTDRVDQAPSLNIIRALLAQGVAVHVHDPKALPQLRLALGTPPGLHESGAYEALVDADALLVLTEWREYWSPDFGRMHASMRIPLLLDGRNIYDPVYVRAQGFTYLGIGRR